MGYSKVDFVRSYLNASTAYQHTHLDIEPSGLGQSPKHLFQCRERRLYEVTSGICFETLFLEGPRMLHPFAHVCVFFFVRKVNRHGSLFASLALETVDYWVGQMGWR